MAAFFRMVGVIQTQTDDFGRVRDGQVKAHRGQGLKLACGGFGQQTCHPLAGRVVIKRGHVGGQRSVQFAQVDELVVMARADQPQTSAARGGVAKEFHGISKT